jgi:hypothetical protein
MADTVSSGTNSMKTKQKKAKASRTSSSSSDVAATTEKQRQELLASSCIPEQVRQTLSAFVMDMQEVLGELEAAEEGLNGPDQQGDSVNDQAGVINSWNSSNRGGSGNGADQSRGGGSGGKAASGSTGGEGFGASMKAVVDQLGLDMAVVTTFVRLLELQLLELEGPEGTGPLEEDLEKLAQFEEQQRQQGVEAEGKGGAAAAAAVGDDDGEGWGLRGEGGMSGGGGEGMEWLRSCVLYRAGQKELARGYLVRARAELSSTMALLTAAVGDEARDEADGEGTS